MPTSWNDAFRALSVFENAEFLYNENTQLGRLRLSLLNQYFEEMSLSKPRALLVGEAPGYRGTAVTGVPFADLSSGWVSVDSAEALRVAYQQEIGIQPPERERTSSFVRREVDTSLCFLWAIYPNHPYLPGNTLTNRKPTAHEILAGGELITGIIENFDIEEVYAVGRVAERQLLTMGISVRESLRHPARGGERAFLEQITVLGLHS